MKYIYGPVKSRRLGLSLGVSLSGYKVCNFDCIYCQLGSTAEKAASREEYAPVEEILDEFRSWLKNAPREAQNLNYITISGSGEPTLNLKIGQLVSEIKKLTAIPVAVITNASLLNDASVRSQLKEADLIVPSLDAVSQEIFQKIDQPIAGINIEDIIGGLIDLRKEYSGKIWLEVMLVKGINDNKSQIMKLKDAVERIRPDKIQLNSPVRCAPGSGVTGLSETRLKKIKDILGDKAEVI